MFAIQRKFSHEKSTLLSKMRTVAVFAEWEWRQRYLVIGMGTLHCFCFVKFLIKSQGHYLKLVIGSMPDNLREKLIW